MRGATKDKVLSVAETLFFTKGFKAVSLKEISAILRVKPASLYYHFRLGKEEIYLAVVQRRVREFRSSVESLAFRGVSLEQILRDFGYWYVEQPPMNMMLIADMDMPYLSVRGKKLVMEWVSESVFAPLQQLFKNYRAELREDLDPMLLIATFSLLLFSIHTSARMGQHDVKKLVDYTVSVFLTGVAKNRSSVS